MKNNQIKQEIVKLQYLIKSFKITLKDMNKNDQLESLKKMNKVIEITFSNIKQNVFKKNYKENSISNSIDEILLS